MTIKEARVAAGLTQKELSALLGIPIDTIRNWDAGRREPPEWARKLIVEKLNTMQERGGE